MVVHITAQGVAHQRSTEMWHSVWPPPVAHTTNPWRMAEVYATGLLTRVVDPGRLRSGRIVLDHLFWRILCQIRNIKYCAEPSVMEPPEHEGSLQRRAEFTELLRISPASPEHYPGIPAIHNSSNQTARATCHALRWRQRYCQTRYTRRYRFIQPALYQRDMSGNTRNLAYRQAG